MNTFVRMRQIPPPGEVFVDKGSMTVSPGGQGAVAAAALSKLGAISLFLARLGNDAYGKRLTRLYEDVGIDTRWLSMDESSPTCQTCILQEEGEEAQQIIFEGAAATLGGFHIQEALSARPDALYMTLELPMNTLAIAANMASERGLPIYIDGAPALPDLDLSLLPRVTVFSPNEQETLALTGILPAGTDSCLLAAMALQKKIAADYYVIKLGNRGAYIYDGIYCHSVASFVIPITDHAGAGAAFTAALALAHLKNGGDMLEAARYANAVSALTLQKSGCFSALPSAEETESFLRKHSRS